GMAVIGEISGDAITYGPDYIFENNPYVSNISVAALSSTRFVATYGAHNGYGTSVIGNIFDDVITFGSTYGFNVQETNEISTLALSATKFVMIFKSLYSPSYGTAIIGDVSADDPADPSADAITYGSKYVFNSDDTYYISGAALSESKFVVAFGYSGNGKGGSAVIGHVSGNTIDFTSKYAFEGPSTYLTSIAALSSSKFVVVYLPIDSQGDLSAVVGEILDDSIIYGSKFVFSCDQTESFTATALSSSGFVISWDSNPEPGGVVLCNVSGRTITFGSTDIFNSASTNYISAAALSPTQFVTAFKDDGDGGSGKAAIGTISNSSLIGIAQESKTDGQQAPVIISGVSDVHSGLSSGMNYYADSSGELTMSVSDNWVGLAISSTELLLNGDGMSNAVNTRLSAWAGSDKISTLGTINSGAWHGDDIAAAYIDGLPASKITSGVFDNVRINWASPDDIGSGEAAAGKFTALSASGAFYDAANEAGTSGQILS
ncbi:MAG: hypothetical protein GY869_08095, partial [Planctomycetes bacterium]|nr:hypothetical protein [Planctomycetota bacterium]